MNSSKIEEIERRLEQTEDDEITISLLYQKIDLLESNNQKLIEKLENYIKKLNENGYFDYLEERDLEKTIEILKEILEILKGEKNE